MPQNSGADRPAGTREALPGAVKNQILNSNYRKS